MLDNVVEVNGLPLAGAARRDPAQAPSRHGLPRPRLRDHLARHEIRLAASRSQFTEDVSREMAVAGWEAALELAKEKGPAPIMLEEFAVTEPRCCASGRRWRATAGRSAQKISGPRPARALQPLHAARRARSRRSSSTSSPKTARASRITARSRRPARSRCRSRTMRRNGIEPSFAHHYFRNVIRAGQEDEGEGRCLLVRAAGLSRARESARDAGLDEPGREAARLLHDCRRHHAARARRHPGRRAEVDRLVDLQDRERADGLQYEEFKDIYLYAHEKGLKGCTTFRFNPEAFQGVLVKEEDLKNTTYRVHARGRQRDRGEGRRGDRVRRREAHRRESLRRVERRLLRQVLRARDERA